MSEADLLGKNIIIIGPPGSGKGTQADLLADKLKIPHISTGDLYRDIATQNTDVGRRVKDLLDRGQLIDDATTFELVDRHFKEIKSGFILDGYPRTLPQAQREAVHVDEVIYLRVDDLTDTERMLLRKRPGETPKLIADRLVVYHRDTEPIVDYYRSQGKLKEIDGSGPIPTVHSLILAALGF